MAMEERRNSLALVCGSYLSTHNLSSSDIHYLGSVPGEGCMARTVYQLLFICRLRLSLRITLTGF